MNFFKTVISYFNFSFIRFQIKYNNLAKAYRSLFFIQDHKPIELFEMEKIVFKIYPLNWF